MLADYFLKKFSDLGVNPKLPENAKSTLINYSWPGNVRELQNVLHTYVTLGKLDLMGQISMAADDDAHIPEELEAGAPGLRRRLQRIERQMILNALERCHWHRGKTAALLQLNYKTLQRKMKAHGIN